MTRPPVVAAAPVATAVTPRPSRRQLREDRRKRRRRAGAVTGALLAVAVLVAAVALASTGGGGRRAGHGPAGRTQHTLLLQLRGADGAALESALLAHDSASRRGVEVLVPSQVVTETPGYGTQAFGHVLALPGGVSLSRAAFSDLAGVTVDASWVLGQTAFEEMVDAVGGVTVTVDTDVVQPVGTDGQTAVVVPAGRARLGGRQALLYATYVGAGEDPTAALPRLQAVLDAVLTALPRTPAQVTALLARLGSGSQASAPATVSSLLVGFAADDAASHVLYSTLPVIAIDTGGAPAYRIDEGRLRSLVSTQLAQSIPPGALSGDNRVFVENGVGTPGLGLSARGRLVQAGFQFVGSGNAPRFGYARSVVLVFQDTPQADTLGVRVARALGLPAGDVRFSPRTQSVADVIVILGRDYRG